MERSCLRRFRTGWAPQARCPARALRVRCAGFVRAPPVHLSARRDSGGASTLSVTPYLPFHSFPLHPGSWPLGLPFAADPLPPVLVEWGCCRHFLFFPQVFAPARVSLLAGVALGVCLTRKTPTTPNDIFLETPEKQQPRVRSLPASTSPEYTGNFLILRFISLSPLSF